MIASQNDRDIEMKPVGIDSRRVFLCLNEVLAGAAAGEERRGIGEERRGNRSHPDAFSNAAGASFAAEVPNAAEAPVAAVLHQRIFSMMTVHSAWMMNRAVWAACGHVPEPSRQHQQSSQSCCASWRIGGGLLSGIIPRRRCPQGCRFQDLQCPLLVG